MAISTWPIMKQLFFSTVCFLVVLKIVTGLYLNRLMIAFKLHLSATHRTTQLLMKSYEKVV